jgi:hypothetical protein
VASTRAKARRSAKAKPSGARPQGPSLQPVDERTFARMIRYAVATGGARLRLRPGARPLQQGVGADRALRFRQLTGDDTRALACLLLERARPPVGARDVRRMALHYEIPGVALAEAQLHVAPGGLALDLELIRPLEPGAVVELLER